jgi:hypothetical protein
VYSLLSKTDEGKRIFCKPIINRTRHNCGVYLGSNLALSDTVSVLVRMSFTSMNGGRFLQYLCSSLGKNIEIHAMEFVFTSLNPQYIHTISIIYP